MVIDDDDMILSAVETVLTDIGYRVIVIADNLRALKHIRKHIPDLLLLDLMMPGKDGVEILMEVKNVQKLQGIPVMLISSASNLSRIARTYGADAFLQKPFSLRNLETQVRELVPL